jgi:hypothetical protein
MEHTDMAKSHLFANKVDVQLDVLGEVVMNGVGGEVDSGNVIAVDHGGLVDRTRELSKKLP